MANKTLQTTQVVPTNTTQNTTAVTPQPTGDMAQSQVTPVQNVGLRETLEGQGYTVGWNPTNSQVTVNGQGISTQGMTNVNGRFMATPEQIQSVISGLTPTQQQGVPTLPQTGNLVPEGGLTRPVGSDLREVAGGLGYKTTYDPTSRLVTVLDPNTGKAIQFESGQGKEYGMAGLRDGYNVVADRDRLQSFFQQQPATNFVDEYKNSLTQTMQTFSQGSTVEESVARIEESMTKTTTAMEGYLSQMQEAINNISSVEEPDTQAMVLNYLNRTSAIYDQMAKQLEQEREEGMDDPALQSALGMMKEEYDFMREQMLSNLRARGMDSGSELARAEARLSKGYMNSRQQMIGNFMSQLNQRVSQGLMQLMGQRAATLAQFGGMDIEQASAMADRRMQRLLTSVNALSGLGDIYSNMNATTIEGVGAIERLRQGEREFTSGLASTILGEAGQERRFQEQMGLTREQFQDAKTRWAKEFGLSESKMDLMLQEFGLAEDRFAEEKRANLVSEQQRQQTIEEQTRSNKINEQLKRTANNLTAEGVDAYKEALTEKIKLETNLMQNEEQRKALTESSMMFESALEETPAGEDETYKEFIASGNIEKTRTAYHYLKQFTTYTDPITGQEVPNEGAQILVDSLYKIVNDYDEAWRERKGYNKPKTVTPERDYTNVTAPPIRPYPSAPPLLPQ